MNNQHIIAQDFSFLVRVIEIWSENDLNKFFLSQSRLAGSQMTKSHLIQR